MRSARANGTTLGPALEQPPVTSSPSASTLMSFGRPLMRNNSTTTETAVIPNTQASRKNAAVVTKLVICIYTLRAKHRRIWLWSDKVPILGSCRASTRLRMAVSTRISVSAAIRSSSLGQNFGRFFCERAQLTSTAFSELETSDAMLNQQSNGKKNAHNRESSKCDSDMRNGFRWFKSWWNFHGDLCENYYIHFLIIRMPSSRPHPRSQTNS
jgi:hypothetical protein